MPKIAFTALQILTQSPEYPNALNTVTIPMSWGGN